MAYGQILGQAQDGDIESIARIINAGWVRIAKWETAGNYSWEAPDLFGGKPYQIGVVAIGGGGGCVKNGRSLDQYTATSGAGADGAVYIYARGIDPDKYAV